MPSGSALAAEVRGLDVSKPVEIGTVERLKDALNEHLLLLLRDQRLTDAQLVRFSRYFGNPKPHVREQPERPVSEIFIVSNVKENGKPIGALGYGELTFHSDLSYMRRPGSFSVVYAVEVPERGGATQWANCYAAYEALPAQTRDRLLELRAVHRHGEAKQNPPTPVSHPVIRTHPDTGRRATFVSPQFTRFIVGLPPEDSRRLLDELFAHVSRPEFVWTHHWRPNDLAIWDNRCTLHRREPFDDRDRRILKRTQMFGEEPFLAS